MVKVLLLLFYCILFSVAVYNVVAQYKKEERINAFICFQIGYILYYIFIPIMSQVIIDLFPEKLNGFVLYISEADSYDMIYAFFYTIISYAVIMFFYHSGKSYNPPKTRFKKKGHDNKNIYLNDSNMKMKIYHFAVVSGILFLFLGVVSELAISNYLGGILNAISMGDKLRAFGVNNSRYIPQNGLFAMTLMVSSLASTYFFTYALRIYKAYSVELLLIISIFSSAFYLMINAGRLGVLLFVLSFFMDFAFRKTKHPLAFMCIVAILMIISLGKLDDLFFFLSYGYVKKNTNDIFSIINEFGFPYLNLLNVEKMNDLYGLRFGVDYVTWIINIIPSNILNIFGLTKVNTGYSLVTEYYCGKNSSGGIPTDLITLAIRQFGFVGIFISGTLMSFLCKYLDKVIDKIYSNNFVFIILRISFMMFVIIPYADLDSFVRNRYDMLAVFIFAVIVSKIKNSSKVNLNYIKHDECRGIDINI